MKKRSEEILVMFIRHPDRKVTIQELKQKYKVSERTIRSDIQEINDFLYHIREYPLFVSDKGLLQADPKMNEQDVYEALKKMGLDVYRLNQTERKIYTMLVLLWSHEKLTMQQIADELYVSRITILKDFEEIRAVIEKADLVLVSDTGKGIWIESSLERKMQLCAELLSQIFMDPDEEGFFSRLMLEKLKISIPMDDICQWVQDCLDEKHLILIDQMLYQYILLLFVLLNYPEARSQIETDCSRFTDSLDRIGLDIAVKNNIMLSPEAMEAFRLCRKKSRIESFVKSMDEVEFYEVIASFLVRIDREMETKLSQDSILIDSLLLHLKNLRSWGSLEFDPSQLEEKVFDYQALFCCVRKNIHIIERYLNTQINEAFCQSIMIHICAAILRQRAEQFKPKVLIVCPGSMATGKYLESQIRNYFEFDLLGCIPIRKMNQWVEESSHAPDFILSTVSLKESRIPHLKVHPVLSMQDMNAISKMAFKIQQKSEVPDCRKPKSSFESLVRQIRKEGLPPHFYMDMDHLLKEYETIQKMELSAIGKLLDVQSIQIIKEPVFWKTAIERTCAPLLERKSIGNGFIRKSIANVEEYGPYILMGAHVAVAHADSGSEVYRDDLALCVFPQGFELPDYEEKVYILFAFASTGVNEYIELFREIVGLGSDSLMVDMLRKAEVPEILFMNFWHCFIG